MAPSTVGDTSVAHATLESSLGVVGSLRVRAYGSVKHAHLVLRKVDEVEHEDSAGRKHKRAVFSLFAHKIINVKAGKELFLYLHPANGELNERSVAFEGDLMSAEDVTLTETTAKETPAPPEKVEKAEKIDEVKVVEEVKPVEMVKVVEVPTAIALEQTLPPKMRKLWAKKAMQSVRSNEPGASYWLILKRNLTLAEHLVWSAYPLMMSEHRPSRILMSTGVQAQPSTSSAAIQAMPSSSSRSAQTHTSSMAHVNVQTSPPPSPVPRVEASAQTIPARDRSPRKRFLPHARESSSMESSQTRIDRDDKKEGESQATSSASVSCTKNDINLRPRSLSPMDMDSPLTSAVTTPSSSPRCPPLSSLPSQNAKLSPHSMVEEAPKAKDLVKVTLNGSTHERDSPFKTKNMHELDGCLGQLNIPTAPKAMKLASVATGTCDDSP